jgi:vacuolar-type H+-ATPase subunit H
MDSKMALDKIKEAEAEAQRIIEGTKKQALDILADANLAKESIIKASQERARLAAKELKLQIEQETQKEILAIQNQNQSDISAVKEKAKVNLDKASQFLKDKIG